MARPKVTINPLWAENLHHICREQGITQADLSEKIHLSQQTLSKIMQGKASLTTQNADAIIKLFPHYRFQWLMGYDRFPTEEDYKTNLLLDAWEEEDRQCRQVENLILVHGYSAEKLSDPETGFPIKGNTTLRIEPGMSDDGILALAHSARPQILISISGPDGKRVQVDGDTYSRVWKDISDFARMRMQLLFERGENNG